MLGKRGWLKVVLTRAVESHRFDRASSSAVAASRLARPQPRARAYVRGILRESGLLYGTPAAHLQEAATDNEERLFLAVLGTFCRVALDVAVVSQAPPGPRAEQCLLLLAAMNGSFEAAEEVNRRLTKSTSVPEKLWRTIEEALEARAPSLTADPSYGLVLHNGAVYSDANVLGRLAIAYFSGNPFSAEVAQRRVRFAAQQKTLLVEVLVGLVSAERPPSYPVRRAILRQIDDLRLPRDLAEHTAAFAQAAFERPPSMKTTLKGVRTRDSKRFILEQTLLASLVDGRRSAREIAWTRQLGALLGFTPTQIEAVELAMAEFYAAHRDVVDVFTVASGAQAVGEEWVDTISAHVQKNYRRLQREIRNTGELSVLLARAARGQPLGAQEKRRMRLLLIDVAKAVPALAIFAAPGGLLLLIALAKVLPFDVLPSAFRDGDSPDDTPPEPKP